jgi:hypothetical protein
MGYANRVLHADFELHDLFAAGVAGGSQTLFAERARSVNRECAEAGELGSDSFGRGVHPEDG